MTENKTKETNQSVSVFLEKVTNEERRQDCNVILQMMKDITRAEPKMWGDSIVGFGRYHYKYRSGREGDMFLVGFSPRKKNLVIYIIPGFAKFQTILAELGKYKLGKSCLYINHLSDIDLKILRKLIVVSVKVMKKSITLRT